MPFVNQDPLPNANIGVNRQMYLGFSAPGTYRVSARARESIGMGG